MVAAVMWVVCHYSRDNLSPCQTHQHHELGSSSPLPSLFSMNPFFYLGLWQWGLNSAIAKYLSPSSSLLSYVINAFYEDHKQNRASMPFYEHQGRYSGRAVQLIRSWNSRNENWKIPNSSSLPLGCIAAPCTVFHGAYCFGYLLSHSRMILLVFFFKAGAPACLPVLLFYLFIY